ncbi:MAG: chromosome segregation protein SMC, partial [Azoarcus sp.]|nr:chromosome segregation protein SMC [Azoarcus sp.]
MRLSKLKLAGFKTFVDPTTILVPGNLVGVVGPNGCGKSNIIDAVRWVLGETRASALRGESMQDVIFNGSTARKAVSRASVELVFDNADSRAGGQWAQYAEISVRRTLDRSGESTYYINNLHVRRRDVIDLFLGTGLGPRAYAIIEQGMISRIIEARPEEIRGFLEEAAGVTRYRERRRETEGRLTDARDNLARLDDIRLELGERISHLEVQATAAERYQTLDAALRERQQLLWLIKRNEARAGFDRVAGELRDSTVRIDTDNARLQELEKELEEARAGHLAASEAVHLAQSDFFAAGAEVSRLEAELQHLGETRQRLEARVRQLDTDREHWHARREALNTERTRWEALAENAAVRAEQAEARHQEISDRQPELESAWRAADATVTSVRRELSAVEQQLRVEEANRVHAGRALDALSQRRAKLDSERGAIEGPDPAQVAEREAWLGTLRERCEALQQELAEAQALQPALQETLREAIEAENSVQRRLTECRARHNALSQLQSKVAAQGELDDWLTSHGHGDLPPLWRSLKVEAGWETAVEAVLRERLAARLTEKGDQLVADLLADPPPDALALGFADILEEEALPILSGPVALSDLVITGDAAQDALLADWLRGWFAVEQLDDWLDRRAALAPGVCLITPRGQVLSRGMLAHFVPDSRTHGLIERQREIDALIEHRQALEDELYSAQQALHDAQDAAARVQSRIDALRSETQATQAERHAGEVEVLKLVQAANRAEEQRSRLEGDLSELLRQEGGEHERHAQAELEHARASELAERQRTQLDAAIDALRERDSALRDLRALEQSLAHELQEARFSERECAGKLEDNVHNLQLAGEQLERVASERKDREAEIEATDDSRCREALQMALDVRGSRETALGGRRD